jgi:tRNA uridine 5-carboxymethylaminomethyl modification enzyme
MNPYRTQLLLNEEIDQYQARFLAKYKNLMDFCDETMIPETSELLVQFSGPTELQKLVRRLSVSELLRQGWLNPITTLEKTLQHYGLQVDEDLIKTVAISKKYDGYIKRSEDQNERLKKMDSMKIDWQKIISSGNVSFECKQRIERIRPETFGQLKLIEGIRPATLVVVASKAL